MDSHFEQILRTITQKGLSVVDCSSLGVTDEMLIALITALEVSPKGLKTLNLSDNKITTQGAFILFEYAMKSTLRELHLSKNQIDDEGALKLLNLFHRTVPILIVNIEENPCSMVEINRLALLSGKLMTDAIREAILTGRAEEIVLDGISFHKMDNRLLKFLFCNISGLKSISMVRCAIGDEGMNNLGSLLKESKIQSLKIENNGLSKMGLTKFFESGSVATHPTINHISVAYNLGINNDAAPIIVNIIEANSTILTFDVSQTTIDPKNQRIIKQQCELNNQPPALKEVVSVLRRGDPIEEVNLQWIENKQNAVSYISAVLRYNHHVHAFNFGNSEVTDAVLKDFIANLTKDHKITSLELPNNSITAEGVQLIFSQLPLIENINLAGNHLTDEVGNIIIEKLRATPVLKFVNVNNNPAMSPACVAEIDGLMAVNQAPPIVRTILPPLEQNDPAVKVLDFSDGKHSLNNECVRLICLALESNVTVEKIDFSHNFVGDTGVDYISKMLEVNTTIVELNLSHNPVTDRAAIALVKMLRMNSTLKILNLSGNYLTNEGVQDYTDMLREHPTLGIIDLTDTQISPDVHEPIKRAASLNLQPKELKDAIYSLLAVTNVAAINLPVSKVSRPLDDSSMDALCYYIKGNKQLEGLMLYGNNVNQLGCQHLSSVLADPDCRLNMLALCGNPIDDFGFVELVRALPENKLLCELDLTETLITDTGCEFALPFFKRNRSVKQLFLPTQANGNASKFLLDEIQANHSPELKDMLAELDAGVVLNNIHFAHESSLGDGGCKLLCSALFEKKTEVVEINFSNNKLTSRSMPYIIRLAGFCPSFSCVDLSINEIDDSGADMLIDYLKTSQQIKKLNIEKNNLSDDRYQLINHLITLNNTSPVLKKAMLASASQTPIDENLDLNGKNGIILNDDDIILLCEALLTSSTVKAVDLRHNKITDVGCIAIAQVLRQNHTIEILLLDNNKSISSEGGAALIYALKLNPQLCVLSIKHTCIPSQEREDILSLLHVNQTPLKEKKDLRFIPFQDLTDELQFKDTNYFTTQDELIKDDSMGKKRAPLAIGMGTQ